MDNYLYSVKMYIPVSIFMAWRLWYNNPQMPMRFGSLVVTSSPRHLQMWIVWFSM